jgi:hypothetical protein
VEYDRNLVGGRQGQRWLCPSSLYIGVQALGEKLSTTAEPVEKVQMANSDNFCTVEINNLQATENRKMPRFMVFRPPRYLG